MFICLFVCVVWNIGSPFEGQGNHTSTNHSLRLREALVHIWPSWIYSSQGSLLLGLPPFRAFVNMLWPTMSQPPQAHYLDSVRLRCVSFVSEILRDGDRPWTSMTASMYLAQSSGLMLRLWPHRPTCNKHGSKLHMCMRLIRFRNWIQIAVSII